MPEPEIDKEKCDLCVVCMEVCPMEVFSKGEDIIAIEEGKCIGCHACEIQCDKEAIKIKD